MDLDVQDAVCAFVRDIISARTKEKIEITARPDRDERNLPAVEELWDSPTRRYAIEHTRVEAFEGQIANQAKVVRLLVPVKIALADRLPGYFCLSVREVDLAARLDVSAVRLEVARLVLEAAGHVPVDEVVTLQSDKLPFKLQLYLRHKNSSNLILYTDIEGDPEARRLDRIHRALDDKCEKLALWSPKDGRTSVLALESNDIQLSNAFVISDAVQTALKDRKDQPDVVVLVETDITPMNGWILKEGNRFGNDVPVLNGGYCYTEGQIRR
jgi:hypothetical protein